MRIVILLLKHMLNKPAALPERPYYQCTYLLRPAEQTPFVIQLVTIYDRQNRQRHYHTIYLN